VRVYVTW
jgi:Transposase DDE domain.